MKMDLQWEGRERWSHLGHHLQKGLLLLLDPSQSKPKLVGLTVRKEVMVCSPAPGQANPCMQASLLARSSHLVAWVCKLPSGYLFDQPHVMTLR